MHKRRNLLLFTLSFSLILACQAVTGVPREMVATQDRSSLSTPGSPQAPTSNLIPVANPDPDEPVFICGEIPYSSPFFLNTISEPFVMLEDQAGFMRRDREFVFTPESQFIGPVTIEEDQRLTYRIVLPSLPQATMIDVDNDDTQDAGVQVFAIAYWANTWGDPFLEVRDGTGWSTNYASTITDSENEHEIIGGTLLVWAPDETQEFPTGFGADGMLFTGDDPVGLLPAGYNLVNLDEEPFRVYKEKEAEITLFEGDVAVNDYSDMSYSEAFQALFDKVSREYPFTEEKGIDWQQIFASAEPQFAQARSERDFYLAIKEFIYQIPDRHISVSFNGDVFYEFYGGGFGLVLAELSDGRVIVTEVIPDTPADQAGVVAGAEIVEWEGQPVTEAIDAVQPFFAPFSTGHHERLEQVSFLARVPPGETRTLSYRNPEAGEAQEITLTAELEYDSLFAALPGLSSDPLDLPIEGEVLPESGLGYIRIDTFSADYRLLAYLWEYYLQRMVEAEVPGLIVDVRANGGGSTNLAYNFAGYFTDQEVELYRQAYFSDETGQFEVRETPARVRPAPFQYEGAVAVLVSPYCVSACEGFTYALQQADGTQIVGHFPTAGAFGEVGRGQYSLPGGFSMQFPTGRPEDANGQMLIEGTGVEPDITVPVTEASALGEADTVLEAAVQALLERIQ